ncbi:caspase domain-containing protein [Ilyonectria destructans]|nr:caspase domain-containing protein [Ilyonectria destructans]
MATKWALLIGVDFYFQQPKRRSIRFSHLRGCVRDVDRVEKYLQTIGVHKIERLTASYDGNDSTPKEIDEATWPTHKNIKTKLASIFDQAKEHDLLYIHYSGHGILRKRQDESDADQGDAITGTALALTDVVVGGAYLTGYQLGVWVQQFVELKNIRVNLVLDSCYSGRGYRNDNLGVRTSHDGTVDESMLESDEAADTDAAKVAASLRGNDTDAGVESNSAERNATAKRSWLSSPTGCTVLTACQLDQTAGEQTFPGQPGRCGVLTHWMLDIVNSHQCHIQPPTYARVAQHVKSRVKTDTSQTTPSVQTPVLHGDGFYGFFGNQQLVQRPASVIQVSKSGSDHQLLSVEVGAAQGVSVGAIYTVHPALGAAEQDPNIIPRIRIDSTSDFRSQATLIDKNTSHEDVIASGSLAVLETWSLPSRQVIKLIPVADSPEWNADDCIRNILGQLEDEIKKLGGISTHPSNSDDCNIEANYTIWVNIGARQINIGDGGGNQLRRVPGISVDDALAIPKIVHIVRHVGRYNALKGYQCPRSSSAFSPDDFRFKPIYEGGETLAQSSNVYKAIKDEKIVIRFENIGSLQNIHVAIFMFNSSWGIEKLEPEGGQPMVQVVPGPQPHDVESFIMCIPKGSRKGVPDEADVIDLYRAYVYAGDQPPSWDELQLPNLPIDASSVSSGLYVEPVLEEDMENEDFLRNATRIKKKRKRSLQGELWTILEFKIHILLV